MITLCTKIYVAGLRAQPVFNFLMHADDRDYQSWWPGIHLKYCILRRGPNHIGTVIFIDQIIGDYRLKMTERILAASPRKIVRQLRWGGFDLPVQTTYDFEEDDDGLHVTHMTYAGFKGWRRIFNPLLRLYFTKRFAAALDQHLRGEFPLLRDLLANPIRGKADALAV